MKRKAPEQDFESIEEIVGQDEVEETEVIEEVVESTEPEAPLEDPDDGEETEEAKVGADYGDWKLAAAKLKEVLADHSIDNYTRRYEATHLRARYNSRNLTTELYESIMSL